MRDRRNALPAAAALAALLALSSCAPAGRPPRIEIGMRCDACGMDIGDLRFAAERSVGKGWRRYDSIECLMRDAAATPGGAVWLPDYDRSTLHPADSLWVVKGSFPSPMGGGLAAFLVRASADSVAAQTSGRVDRFAAIAAAEANP
jgi:nitrous oxide reductase accessory protein NosL